MTEKRFSGVSIILATLMVLAALAGVTGCKHAESPSADYAAEGIAPQAAEPMAKSRAANEMAADRIAGSAPASAPAPATTLQPQLIKTADVTLKVDDLPKATKALAQLVQSVGGITTNQSFSLGEAESSYRSGHLTVRIPQARLDAFLDQLETVGKVISKQVTATDVGMEMVDTAARIRNLQAEEKALQAIMQRTGKIPEVLEVSRELARVRGEIEQAKGRLEYLRQNVAYSSVNISLSEKTVTSPVETQPGLQTVIGNALKQSLGALYGFLLGLVDLLIRVVIFLLPVLVIVGGLLFLVFRLLGKVAGSAWRARKQNRHQKQAAPSVSNQDDPPSD